MDIGQAVKEMKAGKKITRPGWDKSVYCYIEGGFVRGSYDRNITFAGSNLLATDYEVLGTSFEEALAAWKAGKGIRRPGWCQGVSFTQSRHIFLGAADFLATDWTIDG